MQAILGQIKATFATPIGRSGWVFITLSNLYVIKWCFVKLWDIVALMGDIDFVVEAIQKNSWLFDSAWDILLNPPGWFRLALIVFGLVLIFYSVSRNTESQYSIPD